MQGRTSAWYWLSLLVMLGLLTAYSRYRDVRGQYVRYEQSEQEVQRLREELSARTQQEAELQRSVRNLSNDPVEWEAAIRRNKGLVRQGEKVYRVELTPPSGGSQ